MKSWYSLNKKDTKKLENEFLKGEVAKEENLAMHIQIVLGVFLIVLCSTLLTEIIMFNVNNNYLFVILLIGTLLGILIVVMSTIEYHIKFNSWLEIKHKIIKKIT